MTTDSQNYDTAGATTQQNMVGMQAEDTVADMDDMQVMVEQSIEKEIKGAEVCQVLVGIAFFTFSFTILG